MADPAISGGGGGNPASWGSGGRCKPLATKPNEISLLTVEYLIVHLCYKQKMTFLNPKFN